MVFSQATNAYKHLTQALQTPCLGIRDTIADKCKCREVVMFRKRDACRPEDEADASTRLSLILIVAAYEYFKKFRRMTGTFFDRIYPTLTLNGFNFFNEPCI